MYGNSLKRSERCPLRFSSNSMVGFRNVVFSQINICHVTTAYVMDMLKRCLFSYTLTAFNYKVTFFSGVGSVVF